LKDDIEKFLKCINNMSKLVDFDGNISTWKIGATILKIAALLKSIFSKQSVKDKYIDNYYTYRPLLHIESWKILIYEKNSLNLMLKKFEQTTQQYIFTWNFGKVILFPLNRFGIFRYKFRSFFAKLSFDFGWRYSVWNNEVE
jgi:hypothetical protein